MQHWLEGQSAFVVHDWWLEQASNGPQWQALRSACTQQLHAPPGGCPWQPIVKLHGVFRSHPQGSFTHPPYAANAGVLMLVRIGAVQATAAPAPGRELVYGRRGCGRRGSVDPSSTVPVVADRRRSLSRVTVPTPYGAMRV